MGAVGGHLGPPSIGWMQKPKGENSWGGACGGPEEETVLWSWGGEGGVQGGAGRAQHGKARTSREKGKSTAEARRATHIFGRVIRLPLMREEAAGERGGGEPGPGGEAAGATGEEAGSPAHPTRPRP